MLILAFETSAKAASVALLEPPRLLGEVYQNTGLTHSQTLLVMAENLLKQCGKTAQDVTAVAAAHGPGSFTGVRIGAAAAKGFSWGRDIPCYGVSTLEAMAEGLGVWDGYVCPVMDARRKQLYNALFEIRDGIPVRLTEDRLILLEDLKNQLISHKKSVLLVGDGAQMCYNTFITSEELDVALAPSGARYPAAYGAAMEAVRLYREGKTVSSSQLMPLYLRQPQAVRERLAREKQAHSE